jgi:hypothetical protein
VFRVLANARRNNKLVITTAAIPVPTARACALTHATNANNPITTQTASVATTATTRPTTTTGRHSQPLGWTAA